VREREIGRESEAVNGWGSDLCDVTCSPEKKIDFEVWSVGVCVEVLGL